MHLQKGSPQCELNSPASDEIHSNREVVFICRFKFHNLFWTKFRQVRKCLGQIKLQSNFPEILVLLGAFLLSKYPLCLCTISHNLIIIQQIAQGISMWFFKSWRRLRNSQALYSFYTPSCHHTCTNNNKQQQAYLYPINKSNEYNNLSKYKLGTGYLK